MNKSAKILVIDDDPSIIEFIINSLGDIYEVREAETLKAARSQIGNFEFDLILLDVNLPDGKGTNFCRELKDTRFGYIPILFMSGFSDELEINHCLEAGGVDYLVKPMTREDLLLRVTVQCRLKDLENERVKQENFKSIRSMVVTYNHEINNPLTIALGSLRRLEKDFGKENESIVRLKNSLNRIRDIMVKIKGIQDITYKEYGSGSHIIDLSSKD